MARVETAQLCCVRNYNLGCCRYRQAGFRPLPTILGVQPFSVGLSLGLKPSQQQFPPVYPFQQDHFLPSNQYPPSQYDPPKYDHNHNHDHDDHHHDHDHQHHDYDDDYHGSIRPLHNYKPGVCPHQDEDFYRGPIFHGVYNDIPIVPGTSYSASPTCTYDTDCRGVRKCCHVRVSQHRLVMKCRNPLENFGHGTNNWKWRTIQNENGTLMNEDKDSKPNTNG